MDTNEWFGSILDSLVIMIFDHTYPHIHRPLLRGGSRWGGEPPNHSPKIIFLTC
jgi:hypothetical protein